MHRWGGGEEGKNPLGSDRVGQSSSSLDIIKASSHGLSPFQFAAMIEESTDVRELKTVARDNEKSRLRRTN